MPDAEPPRQSPFAALPTERREGENALVLSNMPGAEAPVAGGPAFVSYCLGADVRARLRRDAISRAWAAHRQVERTSSSDVYPTALLVCQVAGVALQDLARLALAFEALPTNDPFRAMRHADLGVLGETYERLADDLVAFRRMLRLPDGSDHDAAPALVALADSITSKHHRQWCGAVDGWHLLSRLSKAMRHGTPLLPRHLVVDAPGAGVLGEGRVFPSHRWVLAVESSIDADAHQRTESTVANLEDRTLRRARQVGLDAISLARQLANAHAHRVRSRSKWAFDRNELKRISPANRRVIRKAARRA